MGRSRKRLIVKGPYETYASGNYETPGTEVIRDLIEGQQWTQEYAATIVGVKVRQMRRYLDPDDTPIPYSAWTLLLYHANYDIGTPLSVAADRNE